MAYSIREVSNFHRFATATKPFASANTMEEAIAFMNEKFNVLVIDLDEENDAADLLANFKNNPVNHSTPMQYAIERS